VVFRGDLMLKPFVEPGRISKIVCRLSVLLLLWCTLLVPALASAQQITPSGRVQTNVVVRANPSGNSAPIDVLRPGERLPLKADHPYWYEVTLADGRTGYVSKAWTQQIEAAPPAIAGGAYEIDAVDVGTGLSVLVTGPDFTLLYDGGSNDDLARGSSNRLLAFLHDARPNLHRIDFLILSHPHRDHVELLPDVFDAYDVGQVWDSGRINPICGYRRFLERISVEPNIVYHNALGANDSFHPSFAAQTCYGQALPAETLSIARGAPIDSTPIALGATGARMTILHADGANYPSPNANSVVVRLDLGQHKLLLMGDAEAGGRQADPSSMPAPDSIEGKLLACCRAALAADIMIAGHHGSRTSSRTPFLDAVGAHIFIISSGPTVYGSVTLPDKVIADELARRGTLLRTDRDDAACATNPHKTGPDADGRAGGCDNIQIKIDAQGTMTSGYLSLPD